MSEFERDFLGAAAFGTFLWAVLAGAAAIGQLF
jgi:hypothetical protein